MELPNFGDHRCSQCYAVGQCSLETGARYFGANPTSWDEVQDLVNQLGGGWKHCAFADCEGDVDQLISLCIATGYVLGKGGQPISSEPGDQTALRGLKMVLKMLGGKHGSDRSG